MKIISSKSIRKLFSVICCLVFLTLAVKAEEIQVGGVTRHFLVHAPANLPAKRPLIISMHGFNQDAAYQKAQAKWEQVADTAGFAVVFPDGINKRWDISGSTDLDFILSIIDNMAARYKIDRNRVYLSGFSMGGMMTYFAANRISDKIAAFAPISGYPLRGQNTDSARPVPIIHTHGTTDDVVSYSGVEVCMNAWRIRNGCSETPIITNPYPASNPNSIASKTYWNAGENGVAMALLTLKGKGHWISNDVVNGVHTSEEIWKFCKNYSLPTSSKR
ncbi:alpha/beta hydrolase family esterase [Desertivirga brevis]|uniref:alpha/beta hydrolase family esterase n=1 Tax=Desertivirga brevis TaxID=2810310 RepID=UPI001A970FCD|nr:PHB depolymerase family esterase [Pedobacter sp. SYSU D00873]